MTFAARNTLSAIADSGGNFLIDHVQVREPNVGEVHVRPQPAGICRLDVKSPWSGPLVMGHEGALELEALISHAYFIDRQSDTFEDLRTDRTTKGVVVFE